MRAISDLLIRTVRPLVLMILLVGTGCAGSGRVAIVSTNLRKLPQNEELIRKLSAHRCYFWIDDVRGVCVAMESDQPSIFGAAGRRAMSMSFVLGQPPAGAARDYKASTSTMRMIARAGYNHTRWASRRGIVSITQTPDGRLRGRFRLHAKQQKFSILTGWRGNQPTVVVGDFVATRNAEQGRRILAQTEVDGMGRRPRRAKPSAADAQTLRQPLDSSVRIKSGGTSLLE